MAAHFVMPTASDSVRVLLLSGDHGPRLRAALAEFIATFTKAEGDLNVATFDGQIAKPAEIITAAETLPFLGTRRLVVVRDFDFTSSAPELAEFLTHVPDTAVLVFTATKPDGRSAVFKQIKKIGEVREFNTPTRRGDFRTLVADDARALGVTLESAAIDRLSAATLGNADAAARELTKLAAYADGRAVTAADIDLLVPPDLHTTVFDLTDQLGARDGRTALATLSDLLRRGENLFPLTYLIARHFRVLLGLKSLPGMPANELASRLKLHPFVVQKSLGQIRNFSVAELIAAHAALLAIDTDVKRGRIRFTTTDQTELALALESFIVRFVAA